jgi:hypothetical protein
MILLPNSWNYGCVLSHLASYNNVDVKNYTVIEFVILGGLYFCLRQCHLFIKLQTLRRQKSFCATLTAILLQVHVPLPQSFVVEIGSHFGAQAGLKLMIFLPPPPECWD